MVAHTQISFRAQNKDQTVAAEYVTFAKKFPSLIHTCGLTQAVAFALAKKQVEYVADLAYVLGGVGHSGMTSAKALDEAARTWEVGDYMRLSRDAIQAASWLKRYVEATGEVD